MARSQDGPLDGAERIAWGPVILATFAAVVVLAIGVDLRLDEVLLTEALPAEDPYNHLAFTREHLADGNVGALYEGGTLYPPGMHALLATYHAYTGVDLHEVFRVGPVLFGALGIVGATALVWRHLGAAAGVLAGLAYAIGPEILFRTTMMAPTAVDMALTPFFLYAMLRLVQGRIAWAGPAAATALYLVFAHPWLLSVLAMAGGIFLLALFLVGRSTEAAEPASAKGLAGAVAILGISWTLSLTGCWGACGEGMRVVTREGGAITSIAPVFAGVALLIAALLAAEPRLFVRALRRRQDRPWPLAARVAASLLLAGATLLVTLVALDGGLPPDVRMIGMFGWPILILAGVGFALLPFAPGPLALMGGALAASTYPFVVFNPFDSPFWSHRTAAYLAVGLVILVGVSARVLFLAGEAVWKRTAIKRRAAAAAPRPIDARSAPRPINARSAPRPFSARPVIGVLLALLVAAPLAGAMYAGTPAINAGGWYRLFEPCEMEELEAVAAAASEDPTTIVIAGSWQSKLVIAAHATHADRIWFDQKFFTSAERRNNITVYGESENLTLIVVEDKYLRQGNPGLDFSSLENRPWVMSGEACADGDPRTKVLRSYTNDGGDSA